jgi:macrolide transport system ATP-binding/permease protein
MVSHDRYFLDRVATRIVTLVDGKAKSYPGNYTAYRQAHAVEVESQLQRYRDEERRTRELRAAILRQASWSLQAHVHADEAGEGRASWVFYRNKAEKIAQRGKAITRRLERLQSERVAAPRATPTFHLALRSGEKGGRFVLVANGLSKAFASPLFAGVSFAVGRGEKVGLVGANGSGKTTLLRILAGEIQADAGTVRSLPAAGVAYLDQHAASLADDSTPVAEVQQLIASQSAARTLLGSFLFDEQRVLTRIGSLSPGERSRLALLMLLLSPANLLLLDEPTNYLDLPSREQVETALASYDGAAVLVSHDRYLLERICTRIIALTDGGVRVYHGGYADYEAHSANLDLGQAPERVARERAQAIPATAQRLLLENRLAVLSGELARLDRGDPAHAAAVEEFMAAAKELRSLEDQRAGSRGRSGR